ncbi:hypothetical protein ABQE93_26945 [Mycolicibacterium sp. XJ662]
MIEPGRPISLGPGEDDNDAEGLLAILRGCRTIRDRRYAGTTHVARQALWSFWELPRLPKPTKAGKYPLGYPWSPDARAALEANPKTLKGGLGLVLEHVQPRNILIQNLIQRSEELDAGELIRYLDCNLAAAVITKAEDDRLTSAGVGKGPLDENDPDPWARYRTAGLNPETFKVVE